MEKIKAENFIMTKNNIKIWIFSLSIIFCVILLLALSVFSRSPIKLFLFESDTIFFEDCIQELANWNTDAYSLENGNYHTAFTCFVFHVLSILVGREMHTVWEIGSSPMIMAVLMIFFGIILFVFFKLLDEGLSDKTLKERSILSIALMMTGPFIYWISSGNLCIISLVCCYFYLLEYDDERRWIRIISYISLAIAVGLSLYPIIFGVLTVEKRKKEFVYLAVFSFLIFFMPYLKYGGVQTLGSLKALVFGTYSVQHENKLDYGLYHMMNLVSKALIGKDISMFVVFFLGIVLFVVLLRLGQEKWKKIFACSLFIIMFSQPCAYSNVLFMYLPLLFFLEDDKRKCGDGIYLLSFIVLFIPYFTVSRTFNQSTSFYCTVFTMLGMVLICLTIIGEKYVLKVAKR